MDQAYSSVFETLFSEFPIIYGRYINELRGVPYDSVLNNLRQVRNQISYEIELNEYKRIRPDAKLFLISNYYHMVLLPVLMAHDAQSEKFPLNEDFQGQIQKDIQLILTEANRTTTEEITSHSILSAINTTWKDLFSTAGISWTRSNDY